MFQSHDKIPDRFAPICGQAFLSLCNHARWNLLKFQSSQESRQFSGGSAHIRPLF
jgi:hypothetical protein